MDLLSCKLFSVTQLTKIYRQSEQSTIVTNAHLVNEGLLPNLTNDSKDFFYENKSDNSDIASSVIQLVSTRLPNFLKIDPSKIQVLCPMKVGISGVENINKELQKIHPTL